MFTVVITSMPAARISSTSCGPLLVRAAGHVGVGELVDAAPPPACGRCTASVSSSVNVGAAVADLAPRHAPPGPSSCSSVCCAAVGLDVPDDDVGAAVVPAAGLAEHGVGLAHARARRRGRPSAGRDAVRPCARSCHSRVVRSLSATAMLSSSTLTRGSPSTPRLRPLVLLVDQVAHLLLAEAVGRGHPRHLQLGVRRRRCAGRDPEPDAVTASGGTSRDRTPSRSAISAWRSLIAAIRSGFSGPSWSRTSTACRSRRRPPTAAAGTAPGRRRSWPISSEPTASLGSVVCSPVAVTSEPLRLPGRDHLGDAGDQQRVGDAEQQGRGEQQPQAGQALAERGRRGPSWSELLRGPGSAR